EEPMHHLNRILPPSEHVEGEGMANSKLRLKRFRLSISEPFESFFGPVDHPSGGFFAGDFFPLTLIITCLGECFGVFDHVLWGQNENISLGVVTGSAGPPCDLVKLTVIKMA